jgi:uracil-DNA glycosylase family 4
VNPSSGQIPDPGIISLLSFWSDAGVDISYDEAPRDRLQPPPVRAAPRLSAPAHAPADQVGDDVASAGLDARHAAASAADLDALEAAIAAFDGCPLKTQGAGRAVFARGRPDAPVMIIGEGPGADEDRLGAPFVGRAGKLLDRMLTAAGLQDQVFITNTVFWRPPGNRTPTAVEQAACRPFVERAIALVRPKLLVLAGGASAKSMLNTSEGILSLRGRWSDWRSEDGAITLAALPTLHPAFLLRQPLAKKKAWVDLMTLKVKLDSLS